MSFDLDFYRELCLAPAPAGFEEPVQTVVRRRLQAVGEPSADVLGNVWADANAHGSPHVAVVGHADQIGLIVTYVDDDGFVFFHAIGGVDHQLLPGRDFVIHTAGGQVNGVGGRRPSHFIPKDERGRAPDLHRQFIDIGAGSRDAALERIAIGDPITFAPRFLELSDGIYASLACDDRAGVYVAVRGLELYAAAGGTTRLTAVSTVQEETTFMGAKAQTHVLRPDCIIVVDVDFASDHPGVDPKRAGGQVKLGRGPVLMRGTGSNPGLLRVAQDVARDEGIAVQMKAAPGATSTDADELMAAGAAVLSLGVPLRYMHSPFEVVCGADLEAAARLVAALARRLGEVFSPGMFVPSA
jgi:putative aminopeptidase FrvX